MPGLEIYIFLLLLWTLPWKGAALWRAARRGSGWWFVALLIVQTLGILEILYLFVFSRDRETDGEVLIETSEVVEISEDDDEDDDDEDEISNIVNTRKVGIMDIVNNDGKKLRPRGRSKKVGLRE